jgi:DNA-binding CsgD family transcriptional regulator
VSWNALPATVRDVAADVLSQRQLEAWKLELAGNSIRAIAVIQSVSRTTARDRLRDARRRLRDAGVVQSTTGKYYLRRAA